MQQQLHLRDIYRIVRKNRVAFFLVFFLSVAGAALVTFTSHAGLRGENQGRHRPQ